MGVAEVVALLREWDALEAEFNAALRSELSNRCEVHARFRPRRVALAERIEALSAADVAAGEAWIMRERSDTARAAFLASPEGRRILEREAASVLK